MTQYTGEFIDSMISQVSAVCNRGAESAVTASPLAGKIAESYSIAVSGEGDGSGAANSGATTSRAAAPVNFPGCDAWFQDAVNRLNQHNREVATAPKCPSCEIGALLWLTGWGPGQVLKCSLESCGEEYTRDELAEANAAAREVVR